MKSIFTPDQPFSGEERINPHVAIENPAAIISDEVSPEAVAKGNAFAQEIEDRFVSDFEKTEALLQAGKVDETDKMVHVSTFVFAKGMIYMSYYANTKEPKEDPDNQAARFVYCPIDNPDDKTFVNVQAVGDDCYGGKVIQLYDTILMQKDEDTLFILWTANVSGNYYRLYRTYTISTKTLSEVGVNRYKVGDVVNDFSTSGIKAAMAANNLPIKTMYSDIGIMQKITTHEENGETWYYTGTYSGDFNAIIKSQDMVTWTYVSQPDFLNQSQWENAVYVIGDLCYYFVRQKTDSLYGFLTVYDLVKGTWAQPVLIADSQSRSDFIVYHGELYLVHAPIDRDHIGIVHVNTDNLAESRVLLQAHMHSSCFYPYVQYGGDELYMSYTVARKHIRLAGFTLSRYL